MQMDAMTELVPGIAYRVSDTLYHSWHALGSSDLRALLRSPAHYRASKEQPKEPSAAMALGTLVHLAILEPERFAREAVIAPDFGDLRTKAAREARDAWHALTAGRIIVTPQDMEIAQRAAEAVRAHPAARALLADVPQGHTEVSMVVRDETSGVWCKARLDALTESSVIVDVKSTTDASLSAFSRSCARYGYHIQAAHYNAVATALLEHWTSFVQIAVETAPPFAVACYALDDAALEAGEEARRRALDLYQTCATTNVWPALPEYVQRLSLPRWATMHEESTMYTD